jgi:tetratricopeptide (TPR) repeat protein
VKTTVHAVLLASIFLLLLAGAASAAEPWQEAQALYDQTMSDFQHGGFGAIAPHVPALEAALAAAGDPVRKTFVEGDTTYVLTEGLEDSLIAMSAQIEAQKHGSPSKRAVSVGDPYPGISLILGSYYNEVQRADDAIRVLSVGLAANPNDAVLVTEKGAALAELKRWPEALQQYSDGLSISNLAPIHKARMLRGEGLALTELGRLDEAEAAYRRSLQLEPGNAIATNELQYLAQLRAGGPKTQVGIMAPNKPTPP